MVQKSSRKICNVVVWCGYGRCHDNQQLLPVASHPVFLVAKSSGLGWPPHVGWFVVKVIWMTQKNNVG
jgi:hypothetical protein